MATFKAWIVKKVDTYNAVSEIVRVHLDPIDCYDDFLEVELPDGWAFKNRHPDDLSFLLSPEGKFHDYQDFGIDKAGLYCQTMSGKVKFNSTSI